jgi:cytochrome P450
MSLIRFLFNSERYRKNPILFHNKNFNEFGDNFTLKISRDKYLIMSRDNDVAQHILQRNQKKFHKSEFQSKFLSKYLGLGLLTINGDFWLRQRRLIQPAFHKEKMNQLVNKMETIIVSNLIDLPENKKVDVFPIINDLAFNVVGKSLFHFSASDGDLDKIKDIIERVQVFSSKEIMRSYKSWWYDLSGQSGKHLLLSKEINQILAKIIDTRKSSGETHNDLLNMLLETRYEDTGEPMIEKQLIDEIKVLFIAGHETTANAMTFMLQLLGRNPEIQEKIYQELVAIPSEISLVDQLQMMEYTNAVINEAMRLFPPAWIADRQNLEQDSFAGFSIKKDTIVAISFYEIHRNPRYWDRPNDFIPERFMGEQKKESLKYFYPFGAGPRKCIGAGFATYEMCLTLSYIIKKYKILSQKEKVKVRPLITLRPIDVEVYFTRR